jgi:hypothetical protein
MFCNVSIVQLRTGHIAVRDYLEWFGHADSLLFPRCDTWETPKHISVFCTRFHRERTRLLHDILRIDDSLSTVPSISLPPSHTDALFPSPFASYTRPTSLDIFRNHPDGPYQSLHPYIMPIYVLNFLLIYALFHFYSLCNLIGPLPPIFHYHGVVRLFVE